MFEIRTEEPYPEDYEAHVEPARRQRLDTVWQRAPAPHGSMVEPFVIECDQERRQLEQFNNWFADDCHHRHAFEGQD